MEVGHGWQQKGVHDCKAGSGWDLRRSGLVNITRPRSQFCPAFFFHGLGKYKGKNLAWVVYLKVGNDTLAKIRSSLCTGCGGSCQNCLYKTQGSLRGPWNWVAMEITVPVKCLPLCTVKSCQEITFTFLHDNWITACLNMIITEQ